ncbi:ABC transporter ATP-binding protein [Phragmitibacter flavus]|uniref:ABC transporter ATP-binding protein n=1 Tax=Phragmitibacter flavus TaxID=2576071 RepID=A0A5R8KF00_9BACT|nr:ABC transporter ATP-binding protein [Phragmitibacter flavus]TLD70868.1 ABC transporter ATP-binding protein [Phragmitibacter flavus]
MPKITQPPPGKKISRKQVTDLSSSELWALTKWTYGKLFRYMKPYRGRFMIGVALGILSGLFNAVMLVGFKIIFSVVLSHGPVAQTATAPSDLSSDVELTHMAFEKPVKAEFGEVEIPVLGKINPVEWVLGYAPEKAGFGLVIAVCSLIPLMLFMRGFLTYLANYSMLWVGNKMLYNLRNDIFRNLLRQSLGFYNRTKIGDLIQTVFNQTRVAQTNAVQLTSVLIQKPVAIITIFAYLMFWDWFFTVSSLIVFPLCLGPIAYVSRRVRRAGSKEEAEAGAMMVNMHESFAGIRVVKANAREEYETKRFNKSNKSMAENIMRWQKALEIIGPVVETVASLGVAAGLVYAWHRGMRAEDFFLVVIALTQIYPHAKELGRVQILMQKCIVASSAVFGYLEQEPDVKDEPDAKKLPPAKGAVTYEDVSFTYTDAKGKPAKKAAVNGIDLTLEPGKFYALVGPSGAGKSTLFALLLRYYDPTAGRVLVDGHDVRTVTQESLRSNIGVVNQDVFLFHDTVKENIRYGRLNATDAEIVAAAKKAHAHDFIMQNKDGYEALVGDGGNNLSGGQKQRLSIARAILRDAPILLLDEATSALDTEVERIIKDAIHTLREGRTVVAIAHRFSTVLEADQIVVMHEGKVVDMGTHAELLPRCELYQRLYQLQFDSGHADPDKPMKDIKPQDLDEPYESEAGEG